MWREIFLFEIKYHLKHPLFYVAAFVLSLLGLLLISTDAGLAFSDAPSAVNRNAPYVIVHGLTVLSLLGLFVVTAFVASSALRDFESGTHMLFFTRPIRKFDYLTGRFAGSMAVSSVLALCTALGMAAGSLMPWQEADHLGPIALAPYVFALLVQVLPNLMMMGALFFAVAIWSRRLLVTYLCVVLFLILQDAAETLVTNFENNTVASLLEPIGVVALESSVRYWTITEFNTSLPALAGGLLYNRMLWSAIGLLVLLWSCIRFSYTKASGRGRAARRASAAPISDQESWSGLPRVSRTYSPWTKCRQLLQLAWMETADIMRSTPFIVMLVMGLILVFTSAYYVGKIMGVSVYPVTHLMIRATQISLQMFLAIIVIFYSGELIWRERALGVAGVRDSMPAPNWVFLGGKLMAMLIVICSVVLAGILSTIGYQIGRGFYRLEPALYAKGFVLITLSFAFLAVLSMLFQVISRNRFIGYLLMIVALIVRRALPELGLEHTLYRYGAHPPAPYSDMNGFGHFVGPLVWFNAHWSFAAATLTGLCVVFWPRGTDSPVRKWLARVRGRFRRPVFVFIITAAGFFAATGSFIYYNTAVVNEYLPPSRREAMEAEYEKKYRQYRGLQMPRITDVKANVDIFPEERRVEIHGSYRLVNKTNAAINTLHVSIDPTVIVNSLDAGDGVEVLADPTLGYYIYELPRPLPAADEMVFNFDLSTKNDGFVNNNSNTQIVHNGTFFNNREYFPSLGYDTARELVDRKKRRRHDLPPIPRMAKVDDLAARRDNYITGDSDWINFETTVSTSPDQIAISPGYLQRQWEEGGRRYFQYKMDSPMLNFYSYSSADYAVRRDRWKDVVIEVYYHEPHDYNIERMIDAVKKSLDYLSENFGPYQYRQLRILEFPRYAHFAQSFPNTIPYSEGLGFIARIAGEDDVDYVFNTTAHEVAHQWWAHQVIGGNVQGATLMSEGLAEYSALMVMEKEYGPDRMRRFLKFELDGYLKGRKDELVEEMPLMLVEDQKYIHYNKGCMVMYALRDYIGEVNLNRALARYLESVAFQDPPYTNSAELVDFIRQATPDSLEYLIRDMFETITLFSNKVETASCTLLDDDRYLVKLDVQAKKLRADGLGNETEIDIDDWIDIGVFGQQESNGRSQEKVLFLEKRRISRSRTTIEVIVNGRPVRAGIDPFNKLIDRDSEDNVKHVREASSA